MYWESREDATEHFYTPGADDQTAQFRTFLPNIAGMGSNVKERRESIANALSHRFLHRIAISTRNGSGTLSGHRTYYFNYTGINRSKIKSIETRSGVPELEYETIFGGGMGIMRLVTPSLPASDKGKLPTWHFRYNVENVMPKGYVFPRTDIWGYWQGEEKSPSRCYVPKTEDDYAPALLKYSMAETLRKVYWPTGGSTEFQYEQNSYSKRLSPDRMDIEDIYGLSGGLRVSSVTVKDTDDAIAYKTLYHYTDVLPTDSPSGPSSGVSDGVPIILKTYNYTDVNGSGSLSVYSESGFKGSATRNNTPDVGYSSVIEERVDATGQSVGFIRYRYSNFDNDIWGDSHMDSSASYAVNASSNGVGIPYSSHSAERGRLLSKEWFNNDGNLLRKEVTKYKRVADSTAVTATQQAMYINSIDGTGHTAVAGAYLGWLTDTRLYKYLPEKTIAEEYTPSGTRTESHSYKEWNKDGLPVRDSTLRSDGLWNITKTEYAAEKPQYGWMRNKWLLAYPVSVSSYTTSASGNIVNGSLRTVTGVYSATGANSNVPYLSKVTKQGKDVYEVLSAESHGKPVDILADGLRSQLSWAYNGQLLSRVADNHTPEEASVLPSSSSMRSPVQDSPVRRFQYNDNRFLEREENSTGLQVTYGYDLWDRLNVKSVDLPTDSLGAIPVSQMADTLLEKYSYNMIAPVPVADVERNIRPDTNYSPTSPVDPNEPDRLEAIRELNPQTGYVYSAYMCFISADYHNLIPDNRCLVNVSDTLTVRLKAEDFVYYREGPGVLPPGRHPLNLYLHRIYVSEGQTVVEPGYRLPLLLDSSTLTVSPYTMVPAGANAPMTIENGELIVTLAPGQYLFKYEGISSDEIGEYAYPDDEGWTEDPDDESENGDGGRGISIRRMLRSGESEPDDPGIPDNPDDPLPGILNYPSYTLLLECLPLDETEETTAQQLHLREYSSVTKDVSRDGTWDNLSKSISYVDGLGRGIMQVLVGASPSNSGDIATLQEFDGWGRPSKQWLSSYVAPSSGLVYTPDLIKNNAKGTYGFNEHPYSYPVYERSMLGRVKDQYGPGVQWHSLNKKTSTEYLTNGSGLACRQFIILPNNNPGNDGNLWSVSAAGYYGAGVLQVTKVTDEDGRIALEYKDMQGKTMLMRSVVSETGGTTINLDTYYIYDAIGNLLAVLPPKASESISADIQTVSDDVLYGLCYQYRYDGRDRCTVKKLPGAESIFYVYDNADRVVLTQDGNNRQMGLSSFTLYDVLGRVAVTGTCTNSINISSDGTSSASGHVAGAIVKAVYGGSTAQIKGYNYTGITLSEPTPLAVTWYDSYDFISSVLGVSSSYVLEAPRYSEELTNTTGLTTGAWSAVLGDSSVIPAQNTGLWSVTRYDLFGREARIVSCDNNGLVITDNEYSHRNSVLKSFITHVPNNGPVFTEEYNSTYDTEERLISQNHSLTGRPAVNAVTNTYDSIGRLKTNTKGGNSLLNQAFTYNIRSWTTKIAGPLFTERLFYNDTPLLATAQWGGNISSLEWSMGSYESAPTVGWDMTYDGLSRLTAVQGRRGGAIFAGDTMSYTYDSMGNLLSKSISTAAGTESSTYNVPTTTNTVSTESYDDNGNQTTSAADGVASINYNILNLPQSVSLSDSTTVYYLYSASGSKLKEVVVPGGDGETETTDYTGNLIYKNGTLHKVLTNGGYIETGDSTLALLNRPAYRYFLTDHLGSVRVVADAQGHVLQQNSQLPYGEDYTPVYASGHAQGGGFTPLPGEPPTGGGSGSGYDEEFEDEGEDGETSGGTSTLEPDSYYRSYNPYKFSGKEQIKSGHYDFGARWYSPRTARWSTQDPLAEKYHSISPYAYCAGNPINLVDPNGARIDDYYSKLNGKYLGSDMYGKASRLISEDEYNSITGGKQIIGTIDTTMKLKKSSKIIESDDIEAKAQEVTDLSRHDKREHQAFILLDRENARITTVDGPVGKNDSAEILYFEGRATGASFYGKPGGPLIIGEIHGHPETMEEGKETLQTMSKRDVDSAKSLQIPIYATDAMSGEVGEKANMHVALPSGRIINNVRQTLGSSDKPHFKKLGYDVLSIWGKSDKPKY